MSFMKAEGKVYKAFYEVKNSWLYFSELKKKTKLSNSSLQNVLKKLKKTNKIEIDKKTSNIFYRIKKKEIPLIFTKLDKERFELLNTEVKIPLKNWLDYLNREISFVLLFGSASRKKEKENSDIDILVVLYEFGNKKLQELYEKHIKSKVNELTKRINSESIYPLKVVFTTINNFKITKDHLIKQARETGFPIYGNLQYYKNEKD